MNQAYESYTAWQSLGDVHIDPATNDRVNNSHRQDDIPLVQRLYEAFRNTDYTIEEQPKEAVSGEDNQDPGKTFSKPIRKVMTDVPDFDLEILCWRLLVSGF